MKKIIKLSVVILALFCTVSLTHSFFTTSTNIVNIFNTKGYIFKINANGGQFNNSDSVIVNGNKTTLPSPTRNGYNFLGWIGSNGNTNQTTVTIPKGTTGNLNYTANWSTNAYYVDVNPVLDGVQNNGGYSGYTFDV